MQIQFDSVSAFLQMGKHGVYVWSCYAITLLALAWGVWSSVRARRRALITIKRQHLRG